MGFVEGVLYNITLMGDKGKSHFMRIQYELSKRNVLLSKR
jgi:hypothetical protein